MRICAWASASPSGTASAKPTTATATVFPTSAGPPAPVLAIRLGVHIHGQEGIDFHWWAHSVIHWNVPGSPVGFEQRDGPVHRYLGHAVRKNVAEAHGAAVLKPDVTDPWGALFSVAVADVAAHAENASTELEPHRIYRGAHKIERRLLDHPLSGDVPMTNHMPAGLAKYRLTLGRLGRMTCWD